MTKVIRALDLGSGWTKASRAVDGKLEFFSFPSLAPRHTGRDLSGSVLSKRDTVVVTVEGTKYEVGPDAGDLETVDSTRNLNDQYIHSDQYRAVMFGALHYMGEKTIDLLVIGLPLTTIHRAEELRKLTVGTHKITDTETVEVKDVLILNQPLGGMYYCLSQSSRPEFEFLREETTVVVDTGYLTFDFITLNGEKVIESRSDAHPGGV
jgi:plasmid segregation protein ParM